MAFRQMEGGAIGLYCLQDLPLFATFVLVTSLRSLELPVRFYPLVPKPFCYEFTSCAVNPLSWSISQIHYICRKANLSIQPW